MRFLLPVGKFLHFLPSAEKSDAGVRTYYNVYIYYDYHDKNDKNR